MITISFFYYINLDLLRADIWKMGVCDGSW